MSATSDSTHGLEAELELELDVQSEAQTRSQGNAVDCSTSLTREWPLRAAGGGTGVSERPATEGRAAATQGGDPRSQITSSTPSNQLQGSNASPQAPVCLSESKYKPELPPAQPPDQGDPTSCTTTCGGVPDCELGVSLGRSPARCTTATSGKQGASPQLRPRIRNLKTANRVSGRPRRSAATSQGNAPLDQLPYEVLSHVFRFVGASDLTNCASVCAAFRAPASEDALWRRLYCARWRSFRGNRRMAGHHFWKLSYLDRDQEDYVRNVLLNGGEHGPAYHAMHLTERAAPVRANEEPTWGMEDTSAQDQLDSYMRAKGFRSGVSKPADVNAMRLIRFGDYYVDEESGWVHLCDSTCDTQAPDQAGAFMVCPVTGRMHGQVPEVLAPGDGAAEVDAADDAADPITTDVGGWLASVYEAGYRHNDDDNKNESMVSLTLS